MPCDVIDLPGGGRAIIRRSRRPSCQFCTREHTKLCDAKIAVGSVGHTRTCDAKMCDLHARRVGPDLDYCPNHLNQYATITKKEENPT